MNTWEVPYTGTMFQGMQWDVSHANYATLGSEHKLSVKCHPSCILMTTISLHGFRSQIKKLKRNIMFLLDHNLCGNLNTNY